jgi:hypothetical protein
MGWLDSRPLGLYGKTDGKNMFFILPFITNFEPMLYLGHEWEIVDT